MRDSVLFLPKLNMPTPGTRTTVGLASRTCGRVLEGVLLVVLGVFGAVGFERGVDELLELRGIAGGIPLDEHGADLGADEVVGAAGAEVRELLRRCCELTKLEDVGSIGEAADPALLAGDGAAETGMICSAIAARSSCESQRSRPPKCLCPAVAAWRSMNWPS